MLQNAIPIAANRLSRTTLLGVVLDGIPVWGLMYNISGDTLMFSVNIEDAEDVYAILQYEGIPILYAPTLLTPVV